LSFWDTKAPLLLLYREIEALPDLPRYDLVLTPQFYVMKREELPLKYAHQAKKLAPSILDELTGEGTFVYEAFPEGDSWVFIAYDLQKLSDFLYIKGGSIDRVGHLYFAEQLRDKLAPPLALDDRVALTLVNDTATVVPAALLGEDTTFGAFDDTFRPEKGFAIKRSHNSYLDPRHAILLAGLLGVLGLAWFAEGYRYHRAIGTAESRLEQLLDANPGLRSSYTREATWKKYSATNAQQRKIRDRIKAISRLTSKETKLDTLTIDSKGYKAALSVPDNPKTLQSLKTLLQDGHLKNGRFSGGKLETSEVFQ